jgi:hypothetical protein
MTGVGDVAREAVGIDSFIAMSLIGLTVATLVKLKFATLALVGLSEPKSGCPGRNLSAACASSKYKPLLA